MERRIKSVAIYVRKSREDETEEVINRQQDILVELCNKNQWEYEIFKEVASSQELDRCKRQPQMNNFCSFTMNTFDYLKIFC